MRPFYEILKMIEAHYANDDDKFESYAKAIIDFYNKDGNIQGIEEIMQIMSTGHITPRTENPRLVPIEKISPFIEESEIRRNNSKSTITDISTIEITDEVVDEPTPKKRHRRTKAEMILVRQEAIDSTDINADVPKKRHRRTKAEMEIARQQALENPIEEQPKKRHRRTKQELIEAGYYNN